MVDNKIKINFMWILKLITAAVTISLVSGVTANAWADTLFVSPAGEGESCSKSQPCSLKYAQEAARAQMASAKSDVTVQLLDGTYRLPAPMQFASADSGKNGHRIVWTAEPGVTPVISGAISASGWQQVDAAKNIWSASVPPGTQTLQIFVNGQRAVRARSRQQVPVKDADGRTINKACNKTTCGYTKAGLSGAPADVLSVEHPEDVVAVIHAHWRDFHCPVSSLSGSSVNMAQPCWNNTAVDSANSWSAASPRGRYYDGVDWFENAYEFLGTPGQFYLDSRSSTLYYVPRSHEDLATADVEVPVLESLINLEGTAAQPVENISFEGLSFQYSTWLQPIRPDGYVSLQAGYLVTGSGLTKLPGNGEGMTRSAAAVKVVNGNNIAFNQVTFAHLGQAGLALVNGTQNSSLNDSTFIDLSGAGIFAGDTTANPEGAVPKSGNITVKNNTFTKVAQEYRDNVAIMGGFLNTVTIDRNTISDLPYSGISVGWGWHYEGSEPTQSNIRITHNRIINVMKDLFDGAGIYTQGYSEPTSVISDNYIDMGGAMANGVYCDEYSNNFDVTNNVILGRGMFPPLKGTTAHFFSAWASYSGHINITGNWTDGGPDEHNRGSTKVWEQNHYNIATRPLASDAEEIYLNSGVQQL